MYTWFEKYLTKRRQRVRVEAIESPWLHIPAGVPQGSVLGPLLFLIYTADLASTCMNRHTKCSQFADDTALITHHHTPGLAQAVLQQSVTAAADWVEAWHLLVNATKTITMSFHPHHQLTIHLNNTPLQQVTCHQHLGVMI